MTSICLEDLKYAGLDRVDIKRAVELFKDDAELLTFALVNIDILRHDKAIYVTRLDDPCCIDIKKLINGDKKERLKTERYKRDRLLWAFPSKKKNNALLIMQDWGPYVDVEIHAHDFEVELYIRDKDGNIIRPEIPPQQVGKLFNMLRDYVYKEIQEPPIKGKIVIPMNKQVQGFFEYHILPQYPELRLRQSKTINNKNG